MTLERTFGDGMAATGVSVAPVRGVYCASLRHFGDATVLDELARRVGAAWPGPLRAVSTGIDADRTLLAWRSPTEFWMVCGDERLLRSVDSALAGRSDAALIEQTGGFSAWTLTGTRVPDLIARIGAPALLPEVGQALVGRLADVTVMALSVHPGEVILIVDRVYSEHLTTWIAETLADF